MQPTDELRAELRELLDEVIPDGGTERDTRFTDAQLDRLLENAACIEEAAAAGWERKALRAMSERGGLEESSAGDERHRFVSLQAYRDHCLAMARMFAAKAGNRSRVFGFDPPSVLGTPDEEEGDLSRLLGVQ